MRRAAWSGLLLLTACAGPLANLHHRSTLGTEAGRFMIDYSAVDQGAQERIQTALRYAAPRLTRFGTLTEPVRVHVLPTHDLLEQAVGRRGYDWLRAWARYDEVFIQSPRTWSLLGAVQSQIDEVMLHELTHCLMYQQGARREDWMRKQIPLWFREGMASVVAEQGYRWASLEDLARFYEGSDSDPVLDAERLYRDESEIVYAAAHHAFAFLVRRYGDDRIRATLRKMREGRLFPEAFQEAVGIGPDAFVRDFERFVRFRGFRGGRVRMLKQRPRPPPGEPTRAPVELAPPSLLPGCRYR